MALHITEFDGGPAHVPVAKRILASHELTLDAENQQTPAVGAATNLVRIHAEEDAVIAIGDDPDATADATVFLGAGHFDYFGISPGQKIAAVLG